MARLTTIRFTMADTAYEVNIDFDDKVIMEDLVAFDVTAKATGSAGRSHSETMRVEINLNERTGRILLREEELYTFSFRDLDVRMDSQTGEEIIPGMDGNGGLKDTVYDHFQEGIGKSVGDIIDAMPVPDPFFGCLIKAGISSIVGQIVTCNELRKNYGNGRRFHQVSRCLREHIKGIALRTIWRSGRCILRLGF